MMGDTGKAKRGLRGLSMADQLLWLFILSTQIRLSMTRSDGPNGPGRSKIPWPTVATSIDKLFGDARA